jgi:Phosphotransferase enzyme family
VLLNLGEPGGFELTPWADRVKLIEASYKGKWELAVLGEVATPAAVLIRPDGHAAWVGDLTDPELRAALITWFGHLPMHSARDATYMAFTTSAAAACAAVSVATDFKIPCTDPVILADGANVIVHLTPSPVVAKIAASTTAVRPDVAACLQRELDVALFLSSKGAPVMPPSAEVPATTHRADGYVMSFWKYLPPTSTAPPDAATLGSMLRDLHAVLRSYPGVAPWLSPLGDISAFLAGPQTVLSDADAAAMAEAFTRLTAQLAQLDGALDEGQVLHGDAGAGNLMATGAGWIWHDFEDVCSGPVAWDLAPSVASRYIDGSRVLAAYGDVVDARQLDICRQFRLLNLAVWYSVYAERLPECRQRAAELVASWRTP